MAKIPMRMRLDLREHWEKEDCPVQKSIAALKELLGLPVLVGLELTLLWNSLQKYYPDQGTFVPNIASIVQKWIDCLARRLDDEVNAAWTEQFLEIVNGDGGRRVQVRVETRPGSRVTTELSKPGAIFVIGIPEAQASLQNVTALFQQDFDQIFEKESAASGQIANDDAGWATVTLPLRPIDEGTTDRRISAVPISLPSIDTLERPEYLFPTLTPYHMIVKTVHNGIEIQGSHAPSLELISKYLRKHVRNISNITIKLPITKPNLVPSYLGYGALFDTLSITSGDSRAPRNDVNSTFNPILIIAFIEGVLKYYPVANGSDVNHWYFKRDVRFLE